MFTTPGSRAGRKRPVTAIPSSRTLWQYRAKTTATAGYPGSGCVIWDNATQTSALHLLLSHITDDGLDIDLFLSFITTGHTILIQNANDSENFQKWSVSGSPTNTNPGSSTSYWTVPVMLSASGGTGTTGFPDNHRVVVVDFP